MSSTCPVFSTHYNNRSLRMTHTKINGPGLIIRYLLKPEPQWTKCFIQIVNCFAPKYNGMRFVSTTHNVETLIKLGLIIWYLHRSTMACDLFPLLTTSRHQYISIHTYLYCISKSLHNRSTLAFNLFPARITSTHSRHVFCKTNESQMQNSVFYVLHFKFCLLLNSVFCS